MVDQHFVINDYSIDGTVVTFSFTLTSVYEGVSEVNEDTYSVDLGATLDESKLNILLQRTPIVKELKETCANALMGIPLQLPENYGGE